MSVFCKFECSSPVTADRNNSKDAESMVILRGCARQEKLLAKYFLKIREACED